MADRLIARVDELADAVGIPRNLPQVREDDLTRIAKDAQAEARSSHAVPRAMCRRGPVAGRSVAENRPLAGPEPAVGAGEDRAAVLLADAQPPNAVVQAA